MWVTLRLGCYPIPLCYPFPAHTPILFWVGVKESWTGQMSAVAMSTCVNLCLIQHGDDVLFILAQWWRMWCVDLLNLNHTAAFWSAEQQQSGILTTYRRIIIYVNEWMCCLFPFDLQKKEQKTELPDKTWLALVKPQTTDSAVDLNKSAKLDLTKRDFEHSSLISHRLSDFH